jgi:hypothetical protein
MLLCRFGMEIYYQMVMCHEVPICIAYMLMFDGVGKSYKPRHVCSASVPTNIVDISNNSDGHYHRERGLR